MLFWLSIAGMNCSKDSPPLQLHSLSQNNNRANFLISHKPLVYIGFIVTQAIQIILIYKTMLFNTPTYRQITQFKFFISNKKFKYSLT